MTLQERLLEAQRQYPNTCYRMTTNDGHYRITGLDGTADGEITAQIVHGRDSYFPGVRAFGVHLNELVRCDCGKWEFPTREQIEATKRELKKD